MRAGFPMFLVAVATLACSGSTSTSDPSTATSSTAATATSDAPATSAATSAAAPVAFDYGPAVAWSALAGLPPSVTLPGVAPTDGTLRHTHYDEAEFDVGGAVQRQHGELWSTYLTFTPDAPHPAPETAQKWASALHASGWNVVDTDGGGRVTLSRTDGGATAWIELSIAEYGDCKLTMVDTRSTPITTSLEAPGAKVEAVSDTQDWPFLTPLPGMTLDSTSARNEPLVVTLAGSTEAVVVGEHYVQKYYNVPSTLSKFEFESAYRQALAKAGWDVFAATELGVGGGGTIFAPAAGTSGPSSGAETMIRARRIRSPSPMSARRSGRRR